MELSPRKQAVLKAIVKAYIETGEPIGSKNLTLLLKDAPSSATLRNEMSELCELGFLKQPHTSAGRIPTKEGYRFYVNSLMSPVILNETVTNFIENTADTISSQPEDIPTKLAEVLSQVTGLPTFTCLISEKTPRIKKVELLPIGRFSTMLLMITDDGRTRSRVFRQGRNFNESLALYFKDLTEKRVKGKPVDILTKAYMQTVIAEAGEFAFDLMPLFTAVFETALEIERAGVNLIGEERLYNLFSEQTARNIISFVNKKEPLISLLSEIEDNVGVIFGADTNFNELSNSTIVASEFTSADKYKGYIGVIGSNRMSYEQIIPCIDYTAKKLSKIMTEAQIDMED